MKILNISMIALALATAGASTAFARGGEHIGNPLSSGAVDTYTVVRADRSAGQVVINPNAGIDQQSAAVLNIEESKDAQTGGN
jgi:hypothetical protein